MGEEVGDGRQILRKVILSIVCCLIFLLILGMIRLQFYQTARTVDKSLEMALMMEGRVRAAYLSQRLDPFWDDWTGGMSVPEPGDWTQSDWGLFEISGEVARNTEGEIQYEYPGGGLNEIREGLDPDLLREVASGHEIASRLRYKSGKFLKRVYLPVVVASRSLEKSWVLVGQPRQAYFSDLLRMRQRYLWITGTMSILFLIFLVSMLRWIHHTEGLKRALLAAEESSEIESLTSTLAHELRNPLSIIQSTAEILGRDEALTADGRDLLQDLLEEVHRLQDVMTRHLHPEAQLTGEIENLARYLEAFWTKRNAHLTNHKVMLTLKLLEPDVIEPVVASSERLEQILDNILRNSLEAMPSGGHLICEMRENDPYLSIHILDSGPGFRRHSRLRPEKVFSGRGVGLRLARKWMGKWGGVIQIRNRRDRWFGRVLGAEVILSFRKVSPIKNIKGTTSPD